MKHKLIPIAVAVLFILAAAVAFYPLVSNTLAERNRSIVRTEYIEQIEQTDDAELAAILAAARGQTSLPIGGKNTNCVIAAHRGWRGADYFRYLDELEIGDTISITNPWEEIFQGYFYPTVSFSLP